MFCRLHCFVVFFNSYGENRFEKELEPVAVYAQNAILCTLSVAFDFKTTCVELLEGILWNNGLPD